MKNWARKDSSVAWLFLAPSSIGFALFYLIPFGMGVFYSFMDRAVDGQYVGLHNYRELIAGDSFRKAAFNTFETSNSAHQRTFLSRSRPTPTGDDWGCSAAGPQGFMTSHTTSS